MSKFLHNLGQQEQLNFLLTNRIPRRQLTKLVGWYSAIESPLLTRLTLKVWKFFSEELNLSESKHQTFNSLRDCFIRELKDGARKVDDAVHLITSPCDAIVGECGDIEELTAYQAKGYPYELTELIPDESIREKYRQGVFVTLRLKSTMYHRFHAPIDCKVKRINYISGDTWNVNPIALKRIENLYCKNERAIVDLQLKSKDHHIALVPVAAILVASMKFNCLDVTLDLKYQGENIINCNSSYCKGDEMGYFQHGSTIILFASSNFKIEETISVGQRINMGEALLSFASAE